MLTWKSVYVPNISLKVHNIDFCTCLIQASAAKHMRSPLFWVITQRAVIVSYRRCGTDMLSRNVSMELLLFAA
jgi:hypothetical protein